MIKDAIRDPLKTIEAERKRLTREVRTQALGYVVGAFGLVAGLAWNEAVKSLIEYAFPQTANSLLAKFVYAAILTVVVVFVTVSIGRLLRTNDDETR